MTTVDQFLADVKRKANLPAGANVKFDTPTLLRIADDVILTQVDPILLTLQEEYDVTREDFALVAGDDSYLLPERAVSGTIIQALVVDPLGRATPLVRIGGSEMWQYEGSQVTASVPTVFAIEGSHVRVLPKTTGSGWSLRLRYRRRPSALVLTSACGLVSLVAGQDVTAAGGTFSATPAVDIVRARAPAAVLVQQKTTTYLANVFTFASGVDLTGVSVGDYVCAQDTTCVIPLPERFVGLALSMVAAQVAEEWGNAAIAASIRETVDGWVTRMETAQSNRASAQPLMAINGDGGLFGGFMGFRSR